MSRPIVDKYRASVGDLDAYTFCGQKITEYSLEDLQVICAVAMNRMREDSERHQAQMATLAGLRKC